jgi:ABC-type cobalamin/Fe3+-siderophores transport system ATPase subunit/ABC-type enterochelin transport system permease subunit
MPLTSRHLLLLGAALAAGTLALVMAALLIGTAGIDAELIRTLRAPRVAAAAGVGALLALSGLAMQSLLRNPLADPYVLGTSGGAAVGALLALMAGITITLGAAAGALSAGGLLLWLARRALATTDDASPRLILAGAMLAAVFGAMASLLLALTPDQRLRGAIFWLVGDLSGADDGGRSLLAALALAAWFVWRERALDRLLLGSVAAHLLGEPVKRLRVELLLGASLAARRRSARRRRRPDRTQHRIADRAAGGRGDGIDRRAGVRLVPGTRRAMSTPLLQTTDLTLGAAGRDLVRDLQWRVEPGQRWCVIGRNAAGKSTLLRALAGIGELGVAQSGDVRWQGRAQRDWSALDAAALRAFMPQQVIDRFPITVARLLALGVVQPRHDMRAVLAALDLAALAQRPVLELSGGERQRVALAQTVLQGAPLLLLDEPVAFQDPAHQASLARWLSSALPADQALVISAHDVNWIARVATHVLALLPGGVCESGAAARMLDAGLLARVYGCRWRESGGVWIAD